MQENGTKTHNSFAKIKSLHSQSLLTFSILAYNHLLEGHRYTFTINIDSVCSSSFFSDTSNCQCFIDGAT